MNLIKRILAVVMVLCVALSLAGCGDTTWIAEIDGTIVPSGLYIYYQTSGYGEALLQLYYEDSSYLMPYLYFYNYGVVYEDILDVTMSSGSTVAEYINEYAMDMCKQAVVLDKLFDELGLEISAEEQAAISNQTRNIWSANSDQLESLGISQTSLEKVFIATYKEAKVFDAYYEIGGLNGTTEEEIEANFSDNFARIKYMTFTFAENMDDAVDESRKNEQLDLANSYLERAQAGESMNDLIADYNEYLASLEDEDDNTKPDLDELTDDEEESEVEEEVNEYANETILSKEQTYPSEKFTNYVFTSCPVGEYTIIQDDLSFYLVERLDILDRDGLYENYRDSILKDLFDDDFTSLINQKLAGYTVNINNNSVKRYTVKKAFPDAIKG